MVCIVLIINGFDPYVCFTGSCLNVYTKQCCHELLGSVPGLNRNYLPTPYRSPPQNAGSFFQNCSVHLHSNCGAVMLNFSLHMFKYWKDKLKLTRVLVSQRKWFVLLPRNSVKLQVENFTKKQGIFLHTLQARYLCISKIKIVFFFFNAKSVTNFY